MQGRARVEIIEIDLSTRTPSFPGIYGAMVLPTSKGDVLNPRLITSESEFFRRMMSTEKVLPRDPLGIFEALTFLKKSNKLWVSRPDTGATFGGAYLSQDIPVSSAKVSVNQGLSSFFLRTATESEASASAFVYSTLSDGDVIRLEGTLPAPLVADTNYFVVKFKQEKFGVRVASSKENALAGEYIEFTGTGSNVSLLFTPDDVNGEQQYPVRKAEGYDLNTSDGRAAGFQSTFNVDVEGDYLNVTQDFYRLVQTGDTLKLEGDPADFPNVDTGLPLNTSDTYYAIVVPMEGPNIDKFKIQLARSILAAQSEEPIGLNGHAGPSFRVRVTGKVDNSSATLDLDTDMFEVSQKFYDTVSTNDKIKMDGTSFPVIAGTPRVPLPNNDTFQLNAGNTLTFPTNKVFSLDIANYDNPAVCYYDYNGMCFGVWKAAGASSVTHFGLFRANGGTYNVVRDFWNSSEGWTKTSYTLEADFYGSYPNYGSNCGGFASGSATFADIKSDPVSTVTNDTEFFIIKAPAARKIALASTAGGDTIDWIMNGAGLSFSLSGKDFSVQPTLDLSKDSLSVSEMFYEMVETGFKMKVTTDGTLPSGLIQGRTYYAIKTSLPRTIKLASTPENAEAGVPVDILDAGNLDTTQNQYHTITDIHNEVLTGYSRRIGYLHTSTPTDEELYYKLFHYPYGKESEWNDFDQSCADLVKEPGAFVVILAKKYDGQFIEVERKTVSRWENHVDGYGQNIYVENVFKSSNYVRWIDNKGVDPNVYPCNQTTFAKLTGGSLGHTATTGECVIALNLLRNKRRYPVTLIMDAGRSIPAYQQAIIDVCESRGATLGILSTPISVEQSSNYLEDLVNYRRRQLITSTSHAALYTPHVKIYDQYNDREIYVSPTGHVGAQISYTAANFEPWFAPAGNRRGVLNVLGVAREFTEGDEDFLYDAGINPIDFHETKGIRIWGQKTLLNRASALDRVNVRMLLIVIEPAIEEALEDFVFEFNDQYTRDTIVSIITSYLEGIKNRRGLYAYSVICDESNNTAEVLDQNELYVDIPIQPTKVAERLVGRIIITRTGASFSIL